MGGRRSRGPPGSCATGQLIVDPGVRLLETVTQRDRRLPAVDAVEHRVVGVATAYALGSGQVVILGHRDAGDVLEDADHLVDRDELGRAEVDRLDVVTGEDLLAAADAVVDVHEAAALLAVTPDVDRVVAAQLRL